MALFNTDQKQNSRYDTPAGKSTVDQVSLLSYQELIHYMPRDGERKTSPTAYAIEEGCYQNPDGDAAWWLRSPGPEPNVPEHLASWSNLEARTHFINDGTISVRPVIWADSSICQNKPFRRQDLSKSVPVFFTFFGEFDLFMSI